MSHVERARSSLRYLGACTAREMARLSGWTERRAHRTLSQLDARGEAVRDERSGRFFARPGRNSP